jgi:hypothetical protein
MKQIEGINKEREKYIREYNGLRNEVEENERAKREDKQKDK